MTTTNAMYVIADPNTDPRARDLLNVANVAVFRAHYGVRNSADLHQVIATRDVLVTAHNALLDPPFDPDDFRNALDGLGQAIETLDAVITPTDSALADFFVEDWTFGVVDGEPCAQHRPRTGADWLELQMEEAS